MKFEICTCQTKIGQSCKQIIYPVEIPVGKTASKGITWKFM